MSKIYTRKEIAALLSALPIAQREGIRNIFFPSVLRTSLDRSARWLGNASHRRRGYSAIVDNGFIPSCHCSYSPCSHEMLYLHRDERRQAHIERRGVRTKLSRQERIINGKAVPVLSRWQLTADFLQA